MDMSQTQFQSVLKLFLNSYPKVLGMYSVNGSSVFFFVDSSAQYDFRLFSHI